MRYSMFDVTLDRGFSEADVTFPQFSVNGTDNLLTLTNNADDNAKILVIRRQGQFGLILEFLNEFGNFGSTFP